MLTGIIRAALTFGSVFILGEISWLTLILKLLVIWRSLETLRDLVTSLAIWIFLWRIIAFSEICFILIDNSRGWRWRWRWADNISFSFRYLLRSWWRLWMNTLSHIFEVLTNYLLRISNTCIYYSVDFILRLMKRRICSSRRINKIIALFKISIILRSHRTLSWNSILRRLLV